MKHKSTQDIVIYELDMLAKEYMVDITVERSWANICTIYFRKGLKTLCNVHLDFQSDSVTAAFTKEKRRAQYFTDKDRWYIDNSDLEKLEGMFNVIRRTIQP